MDYGNYHSCAATLVCDYVTCCELDDVVKLHTCEMGQKQGKEAHYLVPVS